MGILNPVELEKRPRTASLFAGAFISLAVFTVIFTVMAWLIPRFLQSTNSPWARMLPIATILFTGVVVYLRKHRRAKPTVKQ